MEWFTDPSAWMALATLTMLEIVLGIDNIIFISILVGRLPEQQRNRARLLGLALAMIMRIFLLLSLAWIMSLTEPFFTLLDHGFSGRDMILIAGGLFLLAKSTNEIHHALEGQVETQGKSVTSSFAVVLLQIAIIDIVFSLDSVITAVGLAKHVEIMIIAIVLSVLVMMMAAKSISDFVDSHPAFKILALSFLVLIGAMLVAEGFGAHVSKGYVYFAMVFSVLVELLNMRAKNKAVNKLVLNKKLQGGDKVKNEE